MDLGKRRNQGEPSQSRSGNSSSGSSRTNQARPSTTQGRNEIRIGWYVIKLSLTWPLPPNVVIWLLFAIYCIASRTDVMTSSSLGQGLPKSRASSPPFRETTGRPSTTMSNCPCRPFSSSTGVPRVLRMRAAKLAAFVAVVLHVSQYTIRMSIAMSVLHVGVIDRSWEGRFSLVQINCVVDREVTQPKTLSIA